MRKGDKVMKRVESMSLEKWSKGLSILSLDKRRLGGNVRASAMSCFNSITQDQVVEIQGI